MSLGISGYKVMRDGKSLILSARLLIAKSRKIKGARFHTCLSPEQESQKLYTITGKHVFRNIILVIIIYGNSNLHKLIVLVSVKYVMV